LPKSIVAAKKRPRWPHAAHVLATPDLTQRNKIAHHSSASWSN